MGKKCIRLSIRVGMRDSKKVEGVKDDTKKFNLADWKKSGTTSNSSRD